MLIKDASLSGVLLDIPATGRAVVHSEGMMVPEIFCRTVHCLISGTVHRKADGAMALSVYKSPVEFASDAKAARQWNALVS